MEDGMKLISHFLVAVAFLFIAQQQATSDTAVIIDGQPMTFHSLENGKATFLDGTVRVSKGLSELDQASLKKVMDTTGWGRVWEDKSGKFRTIADLVEVVQNAVVLEKIDGKKIVVQLDKLSNVDQAYANSRRNQKADALPNKFVAKVVGISDGDTVTVLLNRRQYKVRLEGIDAPERGQDFGTKSRKHLGDLVQGKQVHGSTTDTDKYGRNLCFLTVDGKRVNHDMVRNGLAWHYRKYSSDAELAELEAEAKSQKRNIWSEAGPVAPWDWRRWGAARRKQWVENQDAQSVTNSPPPSVSPGTGVSAANTPPDKTPALTHWITTSSGVRHNAKTCRPAHAMAIGKLGLALRIGASRQVGC